MEKVNLREKLALFDEHWQPKIVASYNDNDVRVAKLKGEFVWVEDCPRADEEAWVLLVEPSGTVNTGDAGGPMTTTAGAI